MFDFGGPMGGLNGDPDYPNDEEFYNGPSDGGSYNNQTWDISNLKYDKWYYHHKVRVDIISSTDKAWLLQDKLGQYWIPKKLIHIRTHKRARQWNGFKVEYLK